MVHAVGAGKSFLAARRPRHETACQMREKSSAGAINARKEILSVRSKYTRAHVGRCTLRLSATRPLRPIRDDRKRNTAEFPVPRTNASRRAVAVVVHSKGDFETGVTDRKNSFFLAAKEQKAESRGAVHRGPLVKILFTSVAMAARSRAALSHTGPAPSSSFRPFLMYNVKATELF